MTANPVQKVTNASDIKQVEALVRGILGETCWKAHLSYGGELRLEIGAKLPYLQTSMAGKERGTWMLGVRGSGWVLESPAETLVNSRDTLAVIEQRIHDVENAGITVAKSPSDIVMQLKKLNR